MSPAAVPLDALLWGLLGSVVLPLWLLAGLADYWAHARSDIAHTAGLHESALHLLQTAQIGVPVLLVLLARINALTLAVLILGVAAHTVTAYRDVRYAAARRHISPFEQFVHNFLNVLPLAALAIVIVLHWPAFQALLALAEAPPNAWTLQWREPPFERAVIAAVLVASLLFGLLPGVIEFVRTLAARPPAGSR
ncbi:hypothetical protein ACFQZQ_12740 [Lysobacter koreensis]|uniref:Diguanylate cyclase n=1 Tax=Lysobacter koreensis TaxID=266122 RepID=A0ABW2YS78_9GAMM